MLSNESAVLDIYEKIRSHNNGARYYKCDLHTHTPASNCFSKEERSRINAADIIAQATNEKIEVVAITDHNTINFCKPVIDEGKRAGVYIFPGVELSTPEGHLLAIFDPDHPVDLIDEMLTRLGLGRTIRENPEALTTQRFEDVCDDIERCGGVAIAAHVSLAKGFLQVVPDGTRKKTIFNNPCLRGLHVSNEEERDRFLFQKRKGYVNKGCILSSDSMIPGQSEHCLSGLGQKFCYIKMDKVGIEALRQSLFDPTVRIKFPGEVTEHGYTKIIGLYVSQGFLEDNYYSFNPNLNCLVGGKGAGKSLTIECLRFGLNQQCRYPSIEKEIQSMLSAELRNDGMTYVFIEKNNVVYCIVRQYPTGEHSIYRYNDNDEFILIENIENIEDFFKIKAYSQSEIIEIARNPETQMALIDDLINLSSYKESIRLKKEELRQNGANIVTVINSIIAAEEKIRNIGIIKEQIKGLESKLSDKRLQAHRLWHEEESFFSRLNNAIEGIKNSIKSSFESISIPRIDEPEDTPNKILIKSSLTHYGLIKGVLEESKKQTTANLEKITHDLMLIYNNWKLLFDEEETAHKQLLDDLGISGLGEIEERLNELREQLKIKEEVKKEYDTILRPKLESLFEERDRLLNGLQSIRKQIRSIREEKARDLTKKLNYQISIKIRADKNRITYSTTLSDLLRGSRLRSEEVNIIVEKIHPIPLVKLILSRDISKMIKVTNLSQSVCERAINHLSKLSYDELFALQIIDIDDLTSIMIQTEKNVYKDIASLSHGGKCMAILTIAMVDGDFPLIVDQPEDALDTPFIFSHVVATLRQHKEKRQFILSTHNANILVSADAEQVFVLQGTNNRSKIKTTGAIDEFTTRQLVLLNLEGGAEAFSLRRKKYGLVSYVNNPREDVPKQFHACPFNENIFNQPFVSSESD
ncbi:MAG: TrlF family AAA-like ATPase [Syntrophomonadales bacterium]|jgi:hypothetical protein